MPTAQYVDGPPPPGVEPVGQQPKAQYVDGPPPPGVRPVAQFVDGPPPSGVRPVIHRPQPEPTTRYHFRPAAPVGMGGSLNAPIAGLSSSADYMQGAVAPAQAPTASSLHRIRETALRVAHNPVYRSIVHAAQLPLRAAEDVGDLALGAVAQGERGVGDIVGKFAPGAGRTIHAMADETPQFNQAPYPGGTEISPFGEVPAVTPSNLYEHPLGTLMGGLAQFDPNAPVPHIPAAIEDVRGVGARIAAKRGVPAPVVRPAAEELAAPVKATAQPVAVGTLVRDTSRPTTEPVRVVAHTTVGEGKQAVHGYTVAHGDNGAESFVAAHDAVPAAAATPAAPSVTPAPMVASKGALQGALVQHYGMPLAQAMEHAAAADQLARAAVKADPATYPTTAAWYARHTADVEAQVAAATSAKAPPPVMTAQQIAREGVGAPDTAEPPTAPAQAAGEARGGVVAPPVAEAQGAAAGASTVTPVRNASDLATALKTHFGYDEPTAHAHAGIVDAMAQTASKRYPSLYPTPADWYDKHVEGVQSGLGNNAKENIPEQSGVQLTNDRAAISGTPPRATETPGKPSPGRSESAPIATSNERGVEPLPGMAPQAHVAASGYTEVPLARIHAAPDAFQNREEPFSEVTANAIHQEGYNPSKYNPIPVFRDVEGKYGAKGDYVVAGDGHSRYEGFRRLDAEGRLPATIPVKVVSEADAHVLSTEANTGAVPFTPLELGSVYQRDAEAGRTLGQIAQKHRTTLPRVKDALALNGLTPYLRMMVKNGALKPDLGAAMGKWITDNHVDPADADSVFTKFVVKNQLTRPELERALDTLTQARSHNAQIGFGGLLEGMTRGGESFVSVLGRLVQARRAAALEESAMKRMASLANKHEFSAATLREIGDRFKAATGNVQRIERQLALEQSPNLKKAMAAADNLSLAPEDTEATQARLRAAQEAEGEVKPVFEPDRDTGTLFQESEPAGYNETDESATSKESEAHPEAVQRRTPRNDQQSSAAKESTSSDASGYSAKRPGDTQAGQARITRELRNQSQFTGTAAQALDYIDKNPRLTYRGLSSIFIDRDGSVSVLHPHTHEDIARTILKKATSLSLPNNADFSTALTQQSDGILHARAYNDGVEAFIDLDHPPSQAQIEALRDLHAGSTRGHFTAQFYRNGKPTSDYYDNVHDVVRRLNQEGDTRYFQGPKGAVSFTTAGKAIIHALQSPDASTALHEFGHVLVRTLQGDDLAAVEKWNTGKLADWSVAQHERFARAWERYVRTGAAPTDALRQAFAVMKAALTRIYATVKGSAIDVPVTPELKAVFDRVLGGEEPVRATASATGKGGGLEFNWDRIHSDQDVKDAIKAIAQEREPEMQAARGGEHRPWAVAEAEAKALGMNVADIERGKPADVQPDTWAVAVRDVMTNRAQQLRDAQIEHSDNPTAYSEMRLRNEMAKSVVAIKAAMGEKTAAGRALAIHARTSDAWEGEGRPVVDVTTPLKRGFSTDVKSPDFGANNKVFTRDVADAARARLKAKLTGNLYSGIDPTILPDLVEIGGYYLEGGLRTFQAWAQQMRTDFGNKFNDADLQHVWAQARRTAGRRATVLNTSDSFVDRLAGPLGREGVAKFVDQIAAPGGENTILAKILNDEPLTQEERRAVGKAYEDNRPRRTAKGSVSPPMQVIHDAARAARQEARDRAAGKTGPLRERLGIRILADMADRREMSGFDADDVAKDLAAVKDGDIAGYNRVIQKYSKQGPIATFLAVRRADMISNPLIVGKILLSQIAHFGATEIARAPAAFRDAVMTKLYGKLSTGERTMLAPNLVDFGEAVKAAATTGVRGALILAKEGELGLQERGLRVGSSRANIIPSEFSGSVLGPKASRTVAGGAVDRAASAYVRFIGRMHGAAYYPGKVTFAARDISHEARLQALRDVKSGSIPQSQLAARVAELKANPTPQMHEHAAHEAEGGTFLNENAASTALSILKGFGRTKGPIGELASEAVNWGLPIVRVPINIFARAAEYALGVPMTVVQDLYHVVSRQQYTAAEQAASSMRFGRGTVGAAAFITGYLLKQKYGAAIMPPNAKNFEKGGIRVPARGFKRGLNLEAGNIEPTVTPFEMGALEYDREHGIDGAKTFWSNLGFATVTSLPGLDTEKNLVEAASDKDKMAKFAWQEATTDVPASGALRQLADYTDKATLGGGFYRTPRKGVPSDTMRKLVPTFVPGGRGILPVKAEGEPGTHSSRGSSAYSRYRNMYRGHY